MQRRRKGKGSKKVGYKKERALNMKMGEEAKMDVKSYEEKSADTCIYLCARKANTSFG